MNHLAFSSSSLRVWFAGAVAFTLFDYSVGRAGPEPFATLLPAGDAEPQGGPTMKETVSRIKHELVQKYGGEQRARIERGAG